MQLEVLRQKENRSDVSNHATLDRRVSGALQGGKDSYETLPPFLAVHGSLRFWQQLPRRDAGVLQFEVYGTEYEPYPHFQ